MGVAANVQVFLKQPDWLSGYCSQPERWPDCVLTILHVHVYLDGAYLVSKILQSTSRPEAIKLFPCSTQLSMES